MRGTVFYSIAIPLTVVGTIIFTNVLLYASEQEMRSITIVASVSPQRLIVIDRNFSIKKIYSNTVEDVRPTVFLESLDGAEMPYSESVRSQYEAIKSHTNFSRPGIVYERDDRPVQAFLKATIGFWNKLVEF